MTTIKIVNIETGEEIERDMTQDELDAHKSSEDGIKAVQAEKLQKAQDREALLTKLGITAEEAALLLS